jgi:hydroxyquinol 1,2-dioxygenase
MRNRASIQGRAHLFKKSCPYITTDVVYGVKAPLISEFKLMPAGSATPTGAIANQRFWLLEFDFVLQPVPQPSSADTEVVS